MVLGPGTYDFGELRDYWVLSGATPDAGPNQPLLYLLFSPVELTGNYPENFPIPPGGGYPENYAQCAQTDAACNALYTGTYEDIPLVYTISPGQNAIQIGLIGHYDYTPPVPEPAMLLMLIPGLALIAGISWKRGLRRPGSPGFAQ
jgi:hypothetical protein